MKSYRYFLILLVVWVIAIVSAFLVNLYILNKNSENFVQTKSEGLFEILVASINWNIEHGMVYVPITETTQPNSYLKISRRDVITNFGDSLTLMNPASLAQNIGKFAKGSEIRSFHITSLNPTHSDNLPDEWEIMALKTFKKPDDRQFKKTTTKDSINYRYMAPLSVGRNCLNCHSMNNLTIGELHGGISIDTSYHKNYFPHTQTSINKLIIIYTFILSNSVII